MDQDRLEITGTFPVYKELRCGRCSAVHVGVAELDHSVASSPDVVATRDDQMRLLEERLRAEGRTLAEGYVPNVRCPSCGKAPEGVARVPYNRARGRRRGLTWGIAVGVGLPLLNTLVVGLVPAVDRAERSLRESIGMPATFRGAVVVAILLGHLVGFPLLGAVLGALLNVRVFFKKDLVHYEGRWKDLLARNGGEPLRAARMALFEAKAGPGASYEEMMRLHPVRRPWREAASQGQAGAGPGP